jgi:phosphate transport system substrate-binding protein
MRFGNFPRTLFPFVVAICSLSTTAINLLAQTEVVTIDGSSTVYPITKLAAQAFEEETHGKVQVNVAFSGTTGGFRKFVEAGVDIADASRPILKAEIEAARANGVEYIEIPIAYDALTIAVHPENSWAESIKVSELKKLWEVASEGKVTKWNQVRPEWPDAEIKLYGAGRDSGTFDYFSEVVIGKKDGLRRDYIGSEDDTALVRGIQGDKFALGFIPYAYFSDAEGKLKALAIEWDYDALSGRNIKSAPVFPSNRAVTQGQYIPFARPLFLYISVNSLEKPYVRDFLNFFLKNAGTYISRVGYLPLSEIAYRTAIADIEKKENGHALWRGAGGRRRDARSSRPTAALIHPVHQISRLEDSRAGFRL